MQLSPSSRLHTCFHLVTQTTAPCRAALLTHEIEAAAAALVAQPLALVDAAVGIEHAAPAAALVLKPLALVALALAAAVEHGAVAVLHAARPPAGILFPVLARAVFDAGEGVAAGWGLCG